MNDTYLIFTYTPAITIIIYIMYGKHLHSHFRHICHIYDIDIIHAIQGHHSPRPFLLSAISIHSTTYSISNLFNHFCHVKYLILHQREGSFQPSPPVQAPFRLLSTVSTGSNLPNVSATSLTISLPFALSTGGRLIDHFYHLSYHIITIHIIYWKRSLRPYSLFQLPCQVPSIRSTGRNLLNHFCHFKHNFDYHLQTISAI